MKPLERRRARQEANRPAARAGRLRRAVSRILTVTLTAALAIALAGTAQADPPDFVAAVADWLADDEAAALPVLAELAESGDGRAQLLLGLIDKSPALQGPWLGRLPRPQRIALMRRPAGLSGRSWLAEARDQPVAAHWQALLRVDAGLDTAEGFARLGEARAARAAVLTIAAREALAVGPDWPGWLDPELAWAVWPTAAEPLRDRILQIVPEAHPQRAMMGLPATEGALAAWLSDSAVAAPLRAVCDALCPASGTACLIAGYRALGSHGALLTLGSPAETLMSEADFLASPRGQRSVMRRMILSTDMRGRTGLLNRTRALDPCLGDQLAEDSARYRMIREGALRP